MSLAWCQFFYALSWLINAYQIVLLIYAVVSWVPDLRGGWSRYLDAIVEPVLRPLRRLIPPVGGFDIAFLVLLIGLGLINSYLIRPEAYACIP